MRGIDGVRHSVRRRLTVASIGFMVALYALAMNVFATGGEHIPRNQPIPQTIRWTNATPTGVNTTASAIWRNGGVTSHHSFPVAIGASTLGKAFKGTAKRVLPGVGWYMTAKSIIEGAGYLIDELQQQVVSPGTRDDLGQGAACANDSYREVCASVASDLLPHFTTVFADRIADGRVTHFVIRNFGDPQDYVCGVVGGGCNVLSPVVYRQRPSNGWGDTPNVNPGTDPVTLTDYDVGQLLKQSPQVVNAILIDPETGAPLRTAELLEELNALRRSLEAANGIETPGTDLVPSEDWENENTPHDTDRPPFCSWANVVCEFIEWARRDSPDPDDVEIPYEERTLEWQERDSGLGGGSCPAPIVASVFGTTVEFGYEGICGFMEYMKPVAIACAWISAAFIVVNARPARF